MANPQTLPALVRAAASAYGPRPAVVVGESELTFTELHEAVQTTARAYAALGVQPGDRVCVWAPNGWEWVVSGLAVSYAGATLVPANTRYTGHEVVDVVARTRASLLVVADGFLGRSQYAELVEAAADLESEGALVPGLPDLRAVIRIGDGEPPDGVTALGDLSSYAEQVALADLEARADQVSPDDVADILFTSGTTGRSKGVLTAHRQTIAAADVWGRTGGVDRTDRYLVISPFFHSYGYKVGLVTGLLTGCAIYPVATFDPAATLRLIEQQRISVVPGAPAIFQALLDHPDFATTDVSSLRFANTGAANVPVGLVERMQKELSFELVLTAFGMTECCVATMCRPGDADEIVATTCGRAVDGLELRIVDHRTGAVLDAGEEGEVQLRGPMVMLGYLDDAAATAQAIDPAGWLRTGDVGVVDADGYLRITDRLKDMYICGGFNVYPAEVEQELARLDGLAAVAVVGVPDPRLGEVGKAFVVRRDSAIGRALAEDDVIAFARERLANFKVPRSVEFLDGLPRNLAGKVLKNELRSVSDG